jgi:hypothetical protein
MHMDPRSAHPRWNNTKLPRAGHLAQIQGIVYSHLLYLLCDFTKHLTGAVLRYYKGNLCVDMTNLSYLGPLFSSRKRRRRRSRNVRTLVRHENGAWEQGPL